MKKIFPKEFSDLLNRKGLQILAGKDDRHAHERIAVAHNIIKPDFVTGILDELQHKVYPVLRNMHTPVPDDSITSMKKNYSEKLGKSMRMKSIELNSRHTNAHRVAADIGLTEMLSSASYKSMGEALLQTKFGAPSGKQVICYQHGDYVSPHNDHHPEDKHLKHGYFDIQLMLSNKYVKHQWLVYERDGFLNNMVDIAAPSGISVYRLPFWHYTTPLSGSPAKTNEAKRWLLLHSFEFPESQ